MKLLYGSVEELFQALSEGNRVVYWNTLFSTRYEEGIPRTGCTIRVTAAIPIFNQLAVAEVVISCGGYVGERHDVIDLKQKEKVVQFQKQCQEDIEALAAAHGVELRRGILTQNPADSLYGVVKRGAS